MQHIVTRLNVRIEDRKICINLHIKYRVTLYGGFVSRLFQVIRSDS